MKNLWKESDERSYMSRYSGGCRHNPGMEEEILRQAYATTLLGADCALTMHGGGNTSIKVDIEGRRALFVKATGTPLNLFEPDFFVAMDLGFLEGLRSCGGLDDAAMALEFREHQVVRSGRLPSIESLMHAFIPAKVVDHTHPEALLKIANRVGGAELVGECFGGVLAVVPYARMGYGLASAVSEAVERNPGCRGVAIVHHGLVAWGGSAREVYDFTIEVVSRAESFLASIASRSIVVGSAAGSMEGSEGHYQMAAPLVREALRSAIRRINGDDRTIDNVSLVLLNAPDVMELINSPDVWIVREPPLTPDYPMARRILPLWLDVDLGAGIDDVASRITSAVAEYVSDYREYLGKNGVSEQPVADLLPRAVIHPRIGVICVGVSEAAASAVADYTRQAFSIRRSVFETGGVYECLSDEYLFDMQYRGYQRC